MRMKHICIWIGGKLIEAGDDRRVGLTERKVIGEKIDAMERLGEVERKPIKYG